MAMRDKIKAIHEKVGVAYSVLNAAGAFVSDGYLTTELNSQATKPFIKEHFVKAELGYDAAVSVGDVIQFDQTSVRYLVVNKQADIFKNVVILYDAVLYKCNTIGKFKRLVVGRNQETLAPEAEWLTIAAGVNALLTEALYGHELDDELPIGELLLESYELYFPSSFDVKTDDRFWVSNTQFYKVDVVRENRFPGVSVATVSEDTRKIEDSAYFETQRFPTPK
jgi:hypothetical protein